MSGLLIFDTHPIQYRSPLFQSLFKKNPALKVYFFNDRFDPHSWWFHEVGKIPAQNWGLPLNEGFPNKVIHTKGLSLKQKWNEIARILKLEKPKQVAVYGYYLPEHWIVRLLCSRLRIPLIFIGETFHSGPWSFRRLIKAPLRKFFFAGVRYFIPIGTKNHSYYRSLGICETRLIPARYCVDLAFFKQPKETVQSTRKAWRAQWGIPDSAFVVLFVGRLFERKRPQDVLEVQKTLALVPGTYSVIVGNGPLEESLKRGNIPGMVWAGFQNQAGTRDAYYGSDVLFVPSEYETWGLVVNEAAACGLAAVISDTCGVAGDLTLHGETGFIYPKGDVASALHWISRLKQNRALCAELGENARTRVERHYALDQFVSAFSAAMEGSVKCSVP